VTSPRAQSFSSRQGGYRGWAAGVGSALAYGSMAVVAVFAFNGGASPTVLLTLRGIFAMVAIFALWVVSGRVRRVPVGPTLGLVCICGPLFGIQVVAFFAAVQQGGAQLPLIVVHTGPILVMGLVWLRDREPLSARMIALAVAVIGGLFLVTGSGGAPIRMSAVLLALFSACGYAVYLVVSETWVHRVGTVLSAALVTLGATVTIGAIAVVSGESFRVSPTVLQAALVQGLVLTPLGIGGALYAVRSLGSVPMSLLGALEPVAGILLAAVILGEWLALGQWIGVAIILGAGAAVPLLNRRRSASDHPPVPLPTTLGPSESELANETTDTSSTSAGCRRRMRECPA
jgi:drug/metabolite transporter (DMT)-like permease